MEMLGWPHIIGKCRMHWVSLITNGTANLGRAVAPELTAHDCAAVMIAVCACCLLFIMAGVTCCCLADHWPLCTGGGVVIMKRLVCCCCFCRYDAKGGGDASTPEELDALMDAIGKDKQRYEAMLAWKHRQVRPPCLMSCNHSRSMPCRRQRNTVMSVSLPNPPTLRRTAPTHHEPHVKTAFAVLHPPPSPLSSPTQPQQQPNALFRHLWDIQHTSGECFLCQFLARHRANPQPQYDTCLFNRDW